MAHINMPPTIEEEMAASKRHYSWIGPSIILLVTSLSVLVLSMSLCAFNAVLDVIIASGLSFDAICVVSG